MVFKLLLYREFVDSKFVCGKRVLLADDQEGVRQAIKMLLLADDHCVTEASNGKEALMGEVPMVEEIIERLRLLARVGVATEGALGISIPYLRALGKSLGRNHLLALAL